MNNERGLNRIEIRPFKHHLNIRIDLRMLKSFRFVLHEDDVRSSFRQSHITWRYDAISIKRGLSGLQGIESLAQHIIANSETQRIRRNESQY